MDQKHDRSASRQAISAFKGDVYEGLKAWNLIRMILNMHKASDLSTRNFKTLTLYNPTACDGHSLCESAGKDLYYLGDKLANSSQRLVSKLNNHKFSFEYSKAAQLKI